MQKERRLGKICWLGWVGGCVVLKQCGSSTISPASTSVPLYDPNRATHRSNRFCQLDVNKLTVSACHDPSDAGRSVTAVSHPQPTLRSAVWPRCRLRLRPQNMCSSVYLSVALDELIPNTSHLPRSSSATL